VTLDGADRTAIRALVDGYAVAVDRRDIPGFLAVFTPDATLATFEPGGRQRGVRHGHDELCAVPPALERYERTLHLVSTHHVDESDVDGEAVGVAYCEAHHHRPPDPAVGATGDRDRVMYIRYDDRYARRGPGWLIRAREVHVIWVEERPLP
jgi:ketosteroid isomerase-like protein